MTDLRAELVALRLRLEGALEHLGRLEALEAERDITGRRDALLYRLGDLLAPAGTPWARAKAVAEALARFEGAAWSRIRRGGRAPIGEAEEAMAQLLALPGRVPRKPRALWDVFARALANGPEYDGLMPTSRPEND